VLLTFSSQSYALYVQFIREHEERFTRTADLACGAALEIRDGIMSGTPRQEVAKPAFAFHRCQEYTPKY
jgi:hypothetical protein